MCTGPSSRVEPDGTVVISSPCSWAPVGHRLVILGSAAEYGIAPADWILRLVNPRPPVGRADGFGTDPRVAEAALLEALRSREIHPSLVES